MHRSLAAVILVLSVMFNAMSILTQDKPTISITIDDPNIETTGNLTWLQKDSMLLETLSKNDLKAALFVCGKRINSPEGSILLSRWNDAGHMICNHSFSHSYFHSKKITLDTYIADFLRCDSIISGYSNFAEFFRYPFLKEGDTKEKRDGFREFLSSRGCRNGYVSIDASDWYIDGRMNDTLKHFPDMDIMPFKEYYIAHIYSRATFYDSLAFALTGRHIKHTLLLHHSALNAMFLGELITYFKVKGWEFVNASDAYTDEIYKMQPDILPAGESIIWAAAKETGRYEDLLRYPGEDGEYEEKALNNYLKEYYK